ncbi:Spt20 family-domain-containing protein [Abortiporus biennis]|nr:Spt20 family-domain-containing protein [Abortiporus biennis]
MASYNMTRFVEDLLDANAESSSSFTVNLYPEHWTLNNGSKFLYNNHLASLLDDIRAQRIPNDFLELFDAAKLPFYDGCMIAEILDYRPAKGKDPVLEKPERSRVVLTPNSETLWTDICLLNQKNGLSWTDEDALEVEARILMAAAPPLCLEPDPHLTRIANNVLRVSAPTTPASLKRKAAAMEVEEEETEKMRRTKIMQYMDPRAGRSSAPSYRLLDVLQRARAQQNTQTQSSPAPSLPPLRAASVPPHQVAAPNAPAVPVQNGNAKAELASDNPLPRLTPLQAAQLAMQRRIVSGSTSPMPLVPGPDGKPRRAPTAPPTHHGQAQALPRPGSTVPPSIPSHMVPHFQNGRGTPVPTSSQSPRPSSALSNVMSPAAPEKRPPSALQHLQPQPQAQPHHQFPSQPPIQTQAQRQPQPHTQSQAQPMHPVQSSPLLRQNQPSPAHAAAAPAPAQQPSHPQTLPHSAFQPPNPSANFLAQPPQPKKKPQQPPQYNQAQLMLAQQMYQQRMAQGHNGTPIPQANLVAAAAQRNSPMIGSQQLASRSPMPSATPQPPMAHPQQQSYNYVAMTSQYNAQFRPMAHGQAHPQMIQHHLAAPGVQPNAGQQGQVVQGTQDQAHAAQLMTQYPHMFPVNYAQMNMNLATAQAQGRLQHQQFWQVNPMNRGMPVANAQHMAGHPQQMPLGAAGKVVPGGMQGS